MEKSKAANGSGSSPKPVPPREVMTEYISILRRMGAEHETIHKVEEAAKASSKESGHT